MSDSPAERAVIAAQAEPGEPTFVPGSVRDRREAFATKIVAALVADREAAADIAQRHETRDQAIERAAAAHLARIATLGDDDDRACECLPEIGQLECGCREAIEDAVDALRGVS